MTRGEKIAKRYGLVLHGRVEGDYRKDVRISKGKTGPSLAYCPSISEALYWLDGYDAARKER